MNNPGFFCLSLSTVLSFYALLSLLLAIKFSSRALHRSGVLSVHIVSLTSVFISGSSFLLFWVLLLSLSVSFILLNRKGAADTHSVYSVVIMLGILLFLLLVILFTGNPFERAASLPENGVGLYPGFYYPEALIHICSLLVGYSGFTCIFANAAAFLLTGRYGSRHVCFSRKSILVSWFALFTGILFGSQWAYLLKGRGGHWSFSIVHNSTLLPFLFSTALLHSIIIQEKRGMLKFWNILLAVFTFLSILLCSFVSRSPLFVSPHSFSNSPSANLFLSLFLFLSAASFFWIMVRKKNFRSENMLEFVISRESSFLVNNLLFLSISFTILWGISIQALSSAGIIKEIGLGPLYFNRLMAFFGLLILILAAICPYLSWKKMTVGRLAGI